MIKQKLKTRTQLMSAAMMTGVVFGFSNEVLAQGGLDTYSQQVAGQAGVLPNIINLVCYVGGAMFAGLGIVGIKQHVENPGQVELKKPISKMGVGAALLAFPFVSNTLVDGVAGTGTTTFEQFGNARIGGAGGA